MWFFGLLHLCIQLSSLWTSLPFVNRTFQDRETAFWKPVHDLLRGNDKVRVTKYLKSWSSLAIGFCYRLLSFSQLYVERCYVIWFYKRLVRYFSYDLQLHEIRDHFLNQITMTSAQGMLSYFVCQHLAQVKWNVIVSVICIRPAIREIKFDVTWSYV